MILTDIDGVLFEIPQGSIKQVRDRKAYREVITRMNDRFKVKEDVNHIVYLAQKERDHVNTER